MSRRIGKTYDLYAGHKYLHLCNEEKAGKGVEQVSGGVGRRTLHFLHHSSDPVKNEQALLRFLAPLSILPFGAGAASEYGEIRAYLQSRGTPIGPLDMLIAAHARAEGMILVTNNIREFERVPDLELENWAE